MWQGSWILFWPMTISFCNISRLTSWFLLRKITKHTNLFYSGKLEKHRWYGLFCESCWITDHSLLTVNSNKGAINLMKVLYAVLKDKKSSPNNMKGNLHLRQL